MLLFSHCYILLILLYLLWLLPLHSGCSPHAQVTWQGHHLYLILLLFLDHFLCLHVACHLLLFHYLILNLLVLLLSVMQLNLTHLMQLLLISWLEVRKCNQKYPLLASVRVRFHVNVDYEQNVGSAVFFFLQQFVEYLQIAIKMSMILASSTELLAMSDSMPGLHTRLTQELYTIIMLLRENLLMRNPLGLRGRYKILIYCFYYL